MMSIEQAALTIDRNVYSELYDAHTTIEDDDPLDIGSWFDRCDLPSVDDDLVYFGCYGPSPPEQSFLYVPKDKNGDPIFLNQRPGMYIGHSLMYPDYSNEYSPRIWVTPLRYEPRLGEVEMAALPSDQHSGLRPVLYGPTSPQRPLYMGNSGNDTCDSNPYFFAGSVIWMTNARRAYPGVDLNTQKQKEHMQDDILDQVTTNYGIKMLEAIQSGVMTGIKQGAQAYVDKKTAAARFSQSS